MLCRSTCRQKMEALSLPKRQKSFDLFCFQRVALTRCSCERDLRNLSVILSRVKVRELVLRLFDFSPELVEFLGGQAPVLVVVEALDEVQRTVLGELQLRLQNTHRRLETDKLLTTTTANQPTK